MYYDREDKREVEILRNSEAFGRMERSKTVLDNLASADHKSVAKKLGKHHKSLYAAASAESRKMGVGRGPI
jgi:hypothetical protein